jgi:hypothetical protein
MLIGVYVNPVLQIASQPFWVIKTVESPHAAQQLNGSRPRRERLRQMQTALETNRCSLLGVELLTMDRQRFKGEIEGEC